MQIGDRQRLDAEREALRDAFDAVWMASATIGPREKRALRCALALDRPRVHHYAPNWRIVPGARFIGPYEAILG